jgi:Cu/Ag efflux protein CusF
VTRVLCLWFVTVLALMITPTPAAGAQASGPVSESAPVTVTATIEAIDKTARLVTLKGPKGQSAEVKADESVEGFDKLKVGDRVSATYYESVAVNLRKPGDPAPMPGPMSTTVRKENKPGSQTIVQETRSVTVEAIDSTVPSITVKGPKGNLQTFRVRDPQRLQGVKTGDTIDVTVTRGLLIKVERPE